jgi:hypothetical protein
MNRLRILLVALIAPITLGLAGAALQLAWLPTLPEPVAVHWSPGGPDQTGPAWQLTLLTLVVGLAAPAVFTVVALLALRRGPFSPTVKLTAVVPLFTVMVVAGAATVSLGVQRGIASAAHAPDITPAVPLVLASGLIAAALGWLALPRAARRDDDVRAGEPLTLTAQERAVWVGRARPRPATSIGLGATVGALVVAGVFLIGATDLRTLPVLLVPIVLGLAFVAFLDWRVRVDASGLVVRSILGFPTIRVRPEEIERVGTLDVAPMSYGGWGLRGVPGGTIAVVTRAGEGVVVGRRHRGDLVVTVDDARAAAALLSTVAGLGSDATVAGDAR